jgi:hypothetical protein
MVVVRLGWWSRVSNVDVSLFLFLFLFLSLLGKHALYT